MAYSLAVYVYHLVNSNANMYEANKCNHPMEVHASGKLLADEKWHGQIYGPALRAPCDEYEYYFYNQKKLAVFIPYGN